MRELFNLVAFEKIVQIKENKSVFKLSFGIILVICRSLIAVLKKKIE